MYLALCIISSFFIIFSSSHTIKPLDLAKLNISAYVRRDFKRHGFHRILSYNVVVRGQSGETELRISEILPRNLYVDPQQLTEEISKQNVGISVPEFINSELPAHHAFPLSMDLCTTTNGSHRVQIPIHVRYHLPQSCHMHGDSIFLKLMPPTLFIRFKPKEKISCKTNSSDNLWIRLKNIKVDDVNTLQIPVGCSEHSDFVLYTTVAIIAFSAFFFIFMLMNAIKV